MKFTFAGLYANFFLSDKSGHNIMMVSYEKAADLSSMYPLNSTRIQVEFNLYCVLLNTDTCINRFSTVLGNTSAFILKPFS